ncbi:MAG TPA: AAA family ATPase [Pyrinomonadaceae bacterium]|jgi:chloramphenicol 3-O phosphotransferase
MLGTIIVLNGPSGSGKSSLAKALQAQLPEPYMHIGLDNFEQMQPLRNGRRVQVFYGLRGDDPNDPASWGPDCLHIMHQCVAMFAGAGANVIAETIFLGPKWLKDAMQRWSPYRVVFVGIESPLAVLQVREQERNEREKLAGGTGQSVRQLADLAPFNALKPYDLVIDTSVHSQDESAALIRQHLATARPAGAWHRLRAAPFMDDRDHW